MSDRDYVAEAAEQGHVDKDAWRGDPDKWTDAKTCVERGEKIAGILKSKNDRLESRIDSLEQSNRQFGEYHKQTLESQRKKNAEKIADLEVKVAEAVTNGDGQEYTRASREMDSLKAEATSQPNEAQVFDDLAQGWVRENKWYSENPKLAAYADGVSDRLRQQGYVGQAYFTELTRNVEETFPEEFTNPNKSKASATERGGQLSTENSEAQTYDNLPADAKAACDDFVTNGIFKSREDYVATYEWEA